MIEKHTRQLLQHGYTTTVVLYPFKEISTVAHSHIIGSDREATNQLDIRTSCVIHRDKIIKEPLHEMWKYRLKNDYLSQKNGKLEGEEEELLIVNSYMTELYKLYQKGNKRSENEERIRILLEESFSKSLSRAVMGENMGRTLRKDKVDDNHYIAVIPSDWTDKKIAAESILRPIFIDAGLINRDDPPCRLIFVDTLNAIFYSFQKCLSDPDEKHWLKYGTIKKNKQYALFDVDFENKSNVASIACHLFQTGNTNSMVNGIEVFQPHNVSSSRSGKINLVSACTIENNLLGLLYNKKILPLPLSPPPEILTRVSKKDDHDWRIDELLKKMIQIASAYYMNSKSDNKDLINKDISRMPLQRPFRNLDFIDYIKFTKPQSEALEEINMEELYNILFCENETRVKKYIEDCLKEYCENLQGAVLVKRDCSYVTIAHLVNVPYISVLSEKRNDEYKKHADQDSSIKITVSTERNETNDKDNCYIKPISRIIRSCTEKYFSSMATDVLEKLQFFVYSEVGVVEDLLLKIQDDTRNLLKFLPPSIIQYPESKNTSILESTEKANPKYIINIDLSLQSCKYLFVEADKDTKENGTKIDNGSKAEAYNVPSLSRFIRVESHTSVSLHISQKMFNCLLKPAHFQATLDYFAKYDRKVIRGSSDLHEYEEVCDEEDTNPSKLPLSFEFFSPEKVTLLPMIEKLFEKHDNTSKQNPIVTVHLPSYIMAFIVAYLIYLNHKIDASFKQHYIGASDEISYVTSVEGILLDKCLMGSKSIMKELLIASGITNESIIRKQLRVTTQGECSFPIMQEKAKLDLPLKSYYVYAQLYESSIQLTLNQVVKKEPHPMTIVIKSYIIPIKHMHELLCDNLWNQIQSNCHQILCKEHRVDEGKNLEEEREYSVADRLEFEEHFMQHIENLSSLKELAGANGLEIPKGDTSCDCSVYLTHTDIVELSIKPVLNTIASSILGTVTNDQIFGEYYISTLFVRFDSILNSVFHHSYKDLLKSILEHKIKTRLEVKRLEIQHFVFLESDYAEMTETRKCTFSNLFSEGSLLQVSSATYALKLIHNIKSDSRIDIKIYTKDPKTLKLNQVSTNDDNSFLITILERGDQLSFKEERIKKKLYLRLPEEEELEEEELEKERGFFTNLLRFDSKISKDNADYEVDLSILDHYDISLAFSIINDLYFYDYYTKRDPKVKYMPLYINIKPLGYHSLIEMSFEYGHICNEHTILDPELFKMGEQLTLKNTQYVPQVKREEDLTEN